MPEIPRILPPPAATLLIYAAYGWSVHLGDYSPSGRPRQPSDASWLPKFAALLTSPDGMIGLEKLALFGMQAWEVDPAICAVLPAAFAGPGLVDRLAALYPGHLNIIPRGLMAAPLPAAPEKIPAPTAVPPLVEAMQSNNTPAQNTTRRTLQRRILARPAA